MDKVPKVKLCNGVEMPIIGLGTWKSKPGEVEKAVKCAIDIGYRHIDGAMIYENEKEVGNAVKESINAGKCNREDLFIASKLWNTFHKKEKVMEGINITLLDLELEYVDLYLVHFPVGLKEGDDLHPKDDTGNYLIDDVDIKETWKGMEEVCEKGLAKSIGLSNFNSEQIKEIYDSAKIKPAVLQIECHPYFNQNKLIDFCKSYNIAVTAYSPLGSPDRPWLDPNEPTLMEDPIIKAIADHHKKSPAQVLIRFHIERGTIVIPKSANEERIKQNFEVFDFKLTPKEVQTLSSFEKQYRYVHADWWKDSKYYPFKVEF